MFVCAVCAGWGAVLLSFVVISTVVLVVVVGIYVISKWVW